MKLPSMEVQSSDEASKTLGSWGGGGEGAEWRRAIAPFEADDQPPGNPDCWTTWNTVPLMFLR